MTHLTNDDSLQARGTRRRPAQFGFGQHRCYADRRDTL